MNMQAKSLSEITRYAIDVLAKDMGVVATIRFLNQFTAGYGNYTEERDAMFKELTLDDAISAMTEVTELKR